MFYSFKCTKIFEWLEFKPHQYSNEKFTKKRLNALRFMLLQIDRPEYSSNTKNVFTNTWTRFFCWMIPYLSVHEQILVGLQQMPEICIFYSKMTALLTQYLLQYNNPANEKPLWFMNQRFGNSHKHWRKKHTHTYT